MQILQVGRYFIQVTFIILHELFLRQSVIAHRNIIICYNYVKHQKVGLLEKASLSYLLLKRNLCVTVIDKRQKNIKAVFVKWRVGITNMIYKYASNRQKQIFKSFIKPLIKMYSLSRIRHKCSHMLSFLVTIMHNPPYNTKMVYFNRN